MTQTATGRPKVVAREEWLAARLELLAREKQLMREHDALNALRRRLPMVEVSKPYAFESPAGERMGLAGLFDGRRQLIVYHFMFDPSDPPAGKAGAPWAEGCPGCSHVMDCMPHLSHLHARGTSFVVVSRAPQAKIRPFQKRMGWTAPWYSSFGSDFNYDFHATTDEKVAPVIYNYQDKQTLERKGQTYHVEGEQHGLSVFLRDGERVFHTYSTYGRGVDGLLVTYQLMDLTPFGRQEKWEDSPEGWPQDAGPMEWLRHHDRYEHAKPGCACCCGAAKS